MQVIRQGEPEVHQQRGKWVVRVQGYDASTGSRRVRQLGTFATKRAAVAYQRALAAGKAGTDTETVAEFLESVWLPAKRGRVEPTTFDQYTWTVTRHIVPVIGAVRLRDLTPEVLDRWIDELAGTGEGPSERRPLGPTSVRLVRKVLSMAMEEAVQRGRLSRNPVVLTQPPQGKRPLGQLGWTLAQARSFLDAVAGHRLYAAFHVALVTGLRRGEVLGLRWVDIDLDERRLVVVQQLTVQRGRPVLKQLKTAASERIVTFGPATQDVIVRHQEAQAAEREFVGPAWDDSGLVFTTALGGQIDPNNFSRLMDGLIEAAGVPRITPKGLRHTAQSIGRVVVGDDKVMQDRLGHADIGVTLNTYTHTVTEQHRQAGERIDEVFTPRSS